MPAQITGIGWITAAGMGRTGAGAAFAMPSGPLPEIEPASVFPKSDPYFRRLDAYSRLGVAAIALALKDAGLDRWTAKRSIGIIAATRYGCLQTDLDYFETVLSGNGIAPSPSLFSYTLPSIFLGEAALRFGLTGPTFVISRNGSLEPRCLQLALESIEDGEADRMLCGVCDLSAPPALGIDCHQPPGALFFMLEREPAKNSAACGILQLDGSRIFFDRTEIKDLAALVWQCCKFL